MQKLKRAYRKNAKNRSNLKQKALTAGAAAAVTLGASTCFHMAYANNSSETTTDEHHIAVQADSDSDLITNSEEFSIGYDPFKNDQNKNGISDGVDLAKRIAKVIEELPVYDPLTDALPPEQTYKIQDFLYGFETCNVCGASINMGGYEIINPKINITFPESRFLPNLAIHYMSHGSFDYFGSVSNGRVDIARLMRVLEVQFPYEPNDHQLAIVENDKDSDFMTDNEELYAGFNLNDSDQNNNLIPDGIEFAQQCAASINSLPEVDSNEPHSIYKESFMLRGLEYCDICGQSVNMGHLQITNVKLGLSIEVPVITLHYMEHGSFSYYGDVHGIGRIDLSLLKMILEMPQQCGDLGTIFSPADINKDNQVDINDVNDFIEIWLNELNS